MIKAHYAALGLRSKPETAQEVESRYFHRMEQFKDSRERDRAARRVLREARDRCMKEVLA